MLLIELAFFAFLLTPLPGHGVIERRS